MIEYIVCRNCGGDLILVGKVGIASTVESDLIRVDFTTKKATVRCKNCNHKAEYDYTPSTNYAKNISVFRKILRRFKDFKLKV
jgi:DNA-directed RNA polymerase subunit RPC12/RpoP